MQIVNCKMQIVKCKLQNANYKMQITKCNMNMCILRLVLNIVYLSTENLYTVFSENFSPGFNIVFGNAG
jgi:hypothetical protein